MPPDRGANRGTSDTRNAKTKTAERKIVSDSNKKPSPYSPSGGTKSTPVKKTSGVSVDSPKDQTAKDKKRTEKVRNSDAGNTNTREGISKPESVKKVKLKEVTTEVPKSKEPVIKNRTTKDVNLRKETNQTGLRSKAKDTLPVKAQSTRNTPVKAQAIRNTSISKGAIKKEVIHAKEVLPSSKTVIQTKVKSLGSKNESSLVSPSSSVNEYKHRKINQDKSSVSTDMKDKETGRRLGHQRTRTRTLSPRESKLLSTQVEQEEKRKEAERNARKMRNSPIPGTSKDVLISHPPQSNSYDEPDVDEYEYEDDFEDYESDFEDDIESDMSDDKRSINGDTYSITDDEGDTDTDTGSQGLIELTAGHKIQKEEEKKLDSGNYDLAERKRKTKELQEIKLAVERENSAVQVNKERYQLVAADEGFVEGKVDDIKTVSPIIATNFINFASARKRQMEKKATAKVKKRGDELFSMIKLDVMNYYLFDIAPIPYEIYMKSYGRSNTVQAYVQTNEDNLSEEIQTEEVHMKNKWTQKPVTFNTKLNPRTKENGENIIHFSKDYLGVGGDNTDEDPDEWIDRIKVNSIRLNQFLSSAGQVILGMLEEEAAYNQGMLKKSTEQVKFSDGYIELSLKSIPFLVGHPVSSVCFPFHVSTMLLSVHQRINQKLTEDDSNIFMGSLLCVWNILEPSHPQKLLIVSENVTASCFEPEKAGLVFAGLSDGSICVWDLKEHSSYHQKINLNGLELILRSPTYTTAEVLKDGGHTVPVVALRPLVNQSVDSPEERTEHSAVQICSLDESGMVIIWTVIRSYNDASRSGIFLQDLGIAYWGRIRLTLSTVISLQESLSVDQNLHPDLQCFDLAVDGDHLYVSSNTGHVVHCLKGGGKAKPKLYSQKWDGFTFTKCIEICPFLQPFFLVGCSDGTVRLHSRNSDKPLTTIASTGDLMGQGPQVLAIQWLKTKPFVMFVLDSSSRLHFWDLSVSDMYPQYTVSFNNKRITFIQLSQVSGDKKEPVYMAMAASSGSIEIHCLKEEFVETSNEVEKFLHYISHL